MFGVYCLVLCVCGQFCGLVLVLLSFALGDHLGLVLVVTVFYFICADVGVMFVLMLGLLWLLDLDSCLRLVFAFVLSCDLGRSGVAWLLVLLFS